MRQGDYNCGAPSQADFILNYFLSNFLKFPLKLSISSQPGWQAGTINVTLDLTLGGDIFHSPRYNPTDFYAKPIPIGVEFKGPLWHPFRALYNFTTWGMFLFVPVFYLAIFKFRRGQEFIAGSNEIELNAVPFWKQNPLCSHDRICSWCVG